MEQAFVDILKQLVKEQGSDALTDAKKCKSFLGDYTQNKYKKESRFLLQAVDAGVAKKINETDDIPSCKKAQIGELEEERGLNPAIAADIVNTLALVLRGDTTVTVSPNDAKAAAEAKAVAEAKVAAVAKAAAEAKAAASIPVKGKKTYEDGSVYEGDLVNNIPHGKGKITWPDREVIDRSPNGMIAAMFTSLPSTGFDESKLRKFTIKGAVYEGDFVNGKANGKGKKTWMNYLLSDRNKKVDYTYEGDFVDDIFQGKGKLTQNHYRASSVYEGDFVNGKYNGKGKITCQNGEVYEGDFVDGKRTGMGKMTYADGSIDEGNWADDKFIDGKDKGKWEFDDNSWYDGDFVDGKPHGKGKRTWRKIGSSAALAVYEGDFVNGKQHGKGRMTYSDGSFDEGSWVNGKFKGKGPFGLFGRANKEAVEEWERAVSLWKLRNTPTNKFN